jgi:transcriptional regulator of met regulon
MTTEAPEYLYHYTNVELIAETLIHTYNPSAVVRDSDLLGKF